MKPCKTLIFIALFFFITPVAAAEAASTFKIGEDATISEGRAVVAVLGRNHPNVNEWVIMIDKIRPFNLKAKPKPNPDFQERRTHFLGAYRRQA